MVAGLLAIMKAGGAYVPLDPAYPAERLGFMIQDAEAALLLTQDKFRAPLSNHAAKAVCLKEMWTEITDESGGNLGVEPDGWNLAYVIYTSGSTGRPKGIGIVHRSARARLHWAKDVFGAEDLSGVLASTSICLDLSVFEICGPLSRGAKVEIVANALELPQWAGGETITLVNTVPSAMAELVGMNGITAWVGVVSLAGEALQRSLVEKVLEAGRVKSVFNLYGPSEDTTYSTWVRCNGSDQAGRVSIGRPLADTRAYVLDERMGLAPVGAKGELWLSGAGLARGYLNRPELTAERFQPDAICGAAGERMYRTGDQVRWTQHGDLEYLGRLDQQVKLRGYRIETGEIEAVLLESGRLEQAAVVAGGMEGAEKRLIA